jgi:hypothetical protein
MARFSSSFKTYRVAAEFHISQVKAFKKNHMTTSKYV